MTDIDRLIERIVDTSTDLERPHLEQAGTVALPEVAPLAGEHAISDAVDSIEMFFHALSE